MGKVSSTRITAANLRNGSLQMIFPDLYALKRAHENNAWHFEESVFYHTLAVADALEGYLSEASERHTRMLARDVGTRSRADLLRIAALFHDIGKDQHTRHAEGNQITYPGHEDAGVIPTLHALRHTDLRFEDTDRIANLVKFHGLLHQEPRPNGRSIMHYPFSLELVLLGLADMQGSTFPEMHPQQYYARDAAYKAILKNI